MNKIVNRFLETILNKPLRFRFSKYGEETLLEVYHENVLIIYARTNKDDGDKVLWFMTQVFKSKICTYLTFNGNLISDATIHWVKRKLSYELKNSYEHVAYEISGSPVYYSRTPQLFNVMDKFTI